MSTVELLDKAHTWCRELSFHPKATWETSSDAGLEFVSARLGRGFSGKTSLHVDFVHYRDTNRAATTSHRNTLHSHVLRSARQSVALVALRVLHADSYKKWAGLGERLVLSGVACTAAAAAWRYTRSTRQAQILKRRRKYRILAASKACVSAIADNCLSIAGTCCLLSLVAYGLAVNRPGHWFLLQSVAALVDADSRYAKLKQRVKLQNMSRTEVEDAWRATHKAVAQRLAPFLTDLHSAPPLAPLLAVASALSIFHPEPSAFGPPPSAYYPNTCIPNGHPCAPGLSITLEWPPFQGSNEPEESPSTQLSAENSVWYPMPIVVDREPQDNSYLHVSAADFLAPRAVQVQPSEQALSLAEHGMIAAGELPGSTSNVSASDASTTSELTDSLGLPDVQVSVREPVQGRDASCCVVADALCMEVSDSEFSASGGATPLVATEARRNGHSVLQSAQGAASSGMRVDSSVPASMDICQRRAGLLSPENTVGAVPSATELLEQRRASCNGAGPSAASEATRALLSSGTATRWLADPAKNRRQLRQRACHALAAAQGLPLSGSGDHAADDEDAEELQGVEVQVPAPASSAISSSAPPSAARWLTPEYLLWRATVLLVLFAPFVIVGGALLLSAHCVQRASAAMQRGGDGVRARVAVVRRGRVRGVPLQERAPSGEAAVAVLEVEVPVEPVLPEADEVLNRAEAQRAAAGSASRPPGTFPEWARRVAWRLLLFGCQRAGPAFIKWAQWAASRPDVFPTDLCAVMARLHDQAPVHSWEASERIMLEAFGCHPDSLFLALERRPIASGSIAQVYRGLLPAVAGCVPQMVAVKVRHPDVVRCLTADFTLLKMAAAAAECVPVLRGLGLGDSVAQFSSTMTAQADLRVEAAHLERFCNGFQDVWDQIRTPVPWVDLVNEAVIVESFEEGLTVSGYIRDPAPINTQIVARGIDAYLRMLLRHNFVHSDMHPGNIMIAVQRVGEHESICLKILDCGLAEELTPKVRLKFISFLHAIGAGNGRRAATLLLSWASLQNCRDPAAFTDAMESLFARYCNVHSARGIDLDMVIKQVLMLAREFSLSIDGKYVTLLLGVGITVGFAQGLDPHLNLMDAAIPCLLTFNLTGRLIGRLYS